MSTDQDDLNLCWAAPSDNDSPPPSPFPPIPEAAPTPPRRSWRRHWPFVAGAALALGAVLGVGLSQCSSSGSGKHSLVGSMTIKGRDNYDTTTGTTHCTGSSGYDDITSGGSVTITDQAGKVIATDSLLPGTVEQGTCVFLFTVDVPNEPFYGVAIGHRNPVVFSADEIKSDLMASLTIGD